MNETNITPCLSHFQAIEKSTMSENSSVPNSRMAAYKNFSKNTQVSGRYWIFLIH